MKTFTIAGFLVILTFSLVYIIACSPKSEKATITPNEHTSEVIDSVSFLLGEKLFTNSCAACHDRSMRQDMTGPSLAGVEERWSDYPTEDLYEYVRDSRQMLDKGHPKAAEVWMNWEPVMMPSYPNLDDAEMKAIFYYIREKAAEQKN